MTLARPRALAEGLQRVGGTVGVAMAISCVAANSHRGMQASCGGELMGGGLPATPGPMRCLGESMELGCPGFRPGLLCEGLFILSA